jgi:hypothetical protein
MNILRFTANQNPNRSFSETQTVSCQERSKGHHRKNGRWQDILCRGDAPGFRFDWEWKTHKAKASEAKVNEIK